MSTLPRPPIRVLFLAWGFSIHAFRRIKIFADDPRFQVALVSNHRYAIAGVELYPLFQATAPISLSEGASNTAATHGASLRDRLSRNLYRFTAIRLIKDIFLCAVDFRKLWSAYREFCPDTIFLQTLLYPCYLAYALPQKTPVVVTFWNGDVLWWAQWNGLERLFKKWIVTYGANRAAAVTVNSAAAQAACREYGVIEDRIRLIRYPGVDLHRFSAGSRDMARQRLNITAAKVVFCPRGFAPYVNSDVIMRAAQIVCRVLPQTLFLFIAANNREDVPRYMELAQSLGVLTQVRCDEKVAWETMPDYYRAADVMVSISSKDSLPNCMLEAMGCEVPVIMGDIPEISEWVVDGENGYVVPVRDAQSLADRLLTLLQGSEPRIPEWLQQNRRIVENTVDSSVNCEDIKQFVINICEAKKQ